MRVEMFIKIRDGDNVKLLEKIFRLEATVQHVRLTKCNNLIN
jgi:hypothetical protein